MSWFKWFQSGNFVTKYAFDSGHPVIDKFNNMSPDSTQIWPLSKTKESLVEKD